ncbi:MAG: DUF805 domain-containing protein [bacterium]|nr:DUF805 domain-containing protein [bacterium]
MHYYFEVLKKYAVFSGRARRAEYWYFTLFNFLAAVVLGIVSMVVFAISLGHISGMLNWIYAAAAFIPSLAVSVRRLHDTGRSGWWMLMSFVPLIGGIVLLIFFLQDSQPGENKYGPNPKEITAVENS